MPLLTILATPAQIGDRINSAHFHPHQAGNRKTRHEGDIKAAIAVEIGGIVPIQLNPLLMGNKHRYPRAILTLVEHLLGFVIVWIEVHLWLPEDRAFSGHQVVSVNR